MSTSTKTLIPSLLVSQKIFSIRATRVMLDSDLAKLYGIATKNLNKAVKHMPSVSLPISCFAFPLRSYEV